MAKIKIILTAIGVDIFLFIFFYSTKKPPLLRSGKSRQVFVDRAKPRSEPAGSTTGVRTRIRVNEGGFMLDLGFVVE